MSILPDDQLWLKTSQFCVYFPHNTVEITNGLANYEKYITFNILWVTLFIKQNVCPAIASDDWSLNDSVFEFWACVVMSSYNKSGFQSY